MNQKRRKLVPYILLGLSFFMLVVLNIFFQDHWLDSDMAAEMIFSKLLAQTGHIFATPEWYYSTEFRFLYTHLIMTPLFKIFDNWHVIRTITNIVFYVMVLASYYYCVKPLQIKKHIVVWTSIILLLPFSETMMLHMQMGNTYMSHVIIIFTVFGLFLRLSRNNPVKSQEDVADCCGCGSGSSKDNSIKSQEDVSEVSAMTSKKVFAKDRKKETAENLEQNIKKRQAQAAKKKRIVWLVCYLALSVVCGVSGIRYLLALQCPLFFTAFLYLVQSKEVQCFRKMPSKETLKDIRNAYSMSYLFYSLLGMIGCMIGYLINVLWVTRQYVFQTYEATNFIAVYQGVFLNRLQDAFGSLLMLFGYIPDKGVISLRGIVTIAAFLMIGVIGYCVVIVYKKKCVVSTEKFTGEFTEKSVENKDKMFCENRNFITLFFVIAFLLNSFVFVFTNSTLVPRYYITVFIFALPIVARYFEEHELIVDKWCIWFLLFVCFSLSTMKTVFSFLSIDKNEAKREVVEFLAESDYHFGYATYWNANIVTELSNGVVEVANIGDPEHLEFFKWSSPWKYYEEDYCEDEVFLLLTTGEVYEYAQSESLQKGELVYEDNFYKVFVYASSEELFQYAKEWK